MPWTTAMLMLDPQPLSDTAFAPFGHVISGTSGSGRPINHGSSQRVDLPGALALQAGGGQPVLAVFRAQAQAPHGPWRELERHRLGSQSFIPLRGARCIVLVALGEHAPDPATLAAFVVDGGQGFTLRAGTWHHPLIALDSGDFVVLERQGEAVDCEVQHLAEPVALRWA
jgi:ureidoglycolate lyase